MGMFDRVAYNGPLPKSIRCKSRVRMDIAESPMQTKTFRLWEKEKYSQTVSNGDLLTVSVARDGTLFDPDGNKMAFTGDAYIGNGRKNCSFVASFHNGVLYKIEARE